jgi:signal transduction histidine kinase
MFKQLSGIFRHVGAPSLAVIGVVVAIAVTTPLAARGDVLTSAAPTVAIAAYALVMGAAGSVYFSWRRLERKRDRAAQAAPDADVSFGRVLGWLVVGLTVVSLPAIVIPRPSDGGGGWLLLSQIAVVVLLVVVTRVSQRRDVPSDPVLVGVTSGLVVTGATFVAQALVPAFRPGTQATVVLGAVLVLAGLVLATDLLKHTLVPIWARQRLAVCAVALVAAQSAEHLPGVFAAVVTIAGYLVGAVIVCVTALRLQGQALEEFELEMHQMQQTMIEQRELLHELGSTLAGIASASELIRDRDEIPEPRRQRLEEMVDAEVARMVRMMSERAQSSEAVEVDVDVVVGTIVLSHQARGRDVRWHRSGLTVDGRADDIAELVNILLENAARHAGSTPVILTATGPTDDGMVEIACADFGPGIPRHMRGRLFDAGVKRAGSPGQGIGLAIAKRLAAEQSGDLELRPSARGAIFVVNLPAGTETMRTSDVVAHAS